MWEVAADAREWLVRAGGGSVRRQDTFKVSCKSKEGTKTRRKRTYKLLLPETEVLIFLKHHSPLSLRVAGLSPSVARRRLGFGPERRVLVPLSSSTRLCRLLLRFLASLIPLLRLNLPQDVHVDVLVPSPPRSELLRLLFSERDLGGPVFVVVVLRLEGVPGGSVAAGRGTVELC